MTILSLEFWIIIAVVGIIYYKSKNRQWTVLLITSVIMYSLLSGVESLLYIVGIVLISWGGAYFFEYTDANNSLDKANVRGLAVFVVIVLVIAALCIAGLTEAFNWRKSVFSPLGMSYVSLQAIGYVLDVYWRNIKAEKNVFKVGLFLLFFPQIIQGPITNWNQLNEQFYSAHSFEIERIEKGFILVMWGYMKKIAIADRVGSVVEEVFNVPQSYYGGTIGIALLLYSAQLYADFSGGIDIVTGIAMMFDIKLAENFRRPFFSRSLSEFWRRWHISLGKWMKDYVYYSLGTSKLITRISGKIKRKYGMASGRAFTIFICNCIIFCLVGIWHGLELHYLIWGVYNGIIISISNIYYKKFEIRLSKWGINAKSRLYFIMQMVVTFLIVNFGWIMDRSKNVQNMVVMMRNLFCVYKRVSIIELFHNSGFTSPYDWMIVSVAITAIFIMSLLLEAFKLDFFSILYNKNIIVRWAVLYALVFFIAAASVGMNGTGGFMYAQF